MLFAFDSVKANFDRSFIKFGFKSFAVDSEEGMGHDTSKTGFRKANEFIKSVIDKKKV